jgi:serine phosphatase RsbU (regulator of sigma subunit)
VLLIMTVAAAIRLLRSAFAGNRDAWLLLIPSLPGYILATVRVLSEGLRIAGVLPRVIQPQLWLGPSIRMSYEHIAEVLSYLAVAVLIGLRFNRSAEQEQRLATEMGAAREVQSQLVPAKLPVTQQFRFEAAYLAASEVGGDLYQVFPEADGSVLVAIGDVSGKGLKAAMMGTLVVGALRSLAQEALRPAEILTRLNRQLAQSADGGFVTCLVVRLTREGKAIMANAGHLVPWLNGAEVAVDSSLPLGIAANVEYRETGIELAPGDTLTLMSDGVVEARNAIGELYGFERTQKISTQSAQAIAEAAKAHGQEDDITVLTLAFIATSS